MNVSPSVEGAAGSAIIYIARRGWHIDIGFDVDRMGATPGSSLKSLDAEFPGVRYLFFGFGDEHYLLAKHKNGPVLLGALWPGPGMIVATGLTASPGEAFGGAHVVALKVTAAQLQTAEDFVQRSFAGGVDDAGGVKPYAPGPYAGSWYFATNDRYSALHTCNTWAAEALKAGGLRVRSVGVIFASQLWRQVRRLEREQTSDTPKASLLRLPAAGVASADVAPVGFPACSISRVAACHPDTPPSFPNSAERRRSCSSPAAADCCC
jgi:hypothetical protein